MLPKGRLLTTLFVSALLFLLTSVTLADTTLASTFTYQGNLTTTSGPVNGVCDFQFGLYSLVSAGSQIGTTLTKTSVLVSNGVFNTNLDFGTSAFDGQDRYLQIAVRCPAGSGSYTTLSPRQSITPSPYTQYAQRAPWSGLAGIPTKLTALGNLSCSTNQIPKWNGTTWTCSADNSGAGGSFWSLTGNAGTTTGNFIGTTDNIPLEFRVNSQTALRLQPGSSIPNIIGGYTGNTVASFGNGSVVGGGGGLNDPNTIAGSFGVIGGGGHNSITGDSGTIGGGFFNTTTGFAATVPGGYHNTAAGYASFAAGEEAAANHANTFIWSDGNVDGGNGFYTTAANQFAIHASGGIRLVTGSTAQGLDSIACFMYVGQGAWSCTSDRNSKQDFAEVDTRAILDGVASLPITSWAYLNTTTRHIGPMAQDFYTAFHIGENDKTITSVDADGIAFASIQALYTLVQEKDAQLADLNTRVEKLEAQLAPSSAVTSGVSDPWMLIALALACTLGGVVIGGQRGKTTA